MMKNGISKHLIFGYTLVIILCSIASSNVRANAERTEYKFDFGQGKVASGYTQVVWETIYSQKLGYGFEPGSHIISINRHTENELTGDLCTSSEPFYFSIKLPEGNYKVTIIFGDQKNESITTVKAELRRLMLEKIKTEPGEYKTKTIIVNIRTPNISNGGQVSLKDREKTTEFLAWDDKLTLEFNDENPCICAMEISKVDNIPVIYLLGDSTVCDQPTEPWNSWGQMLPRFFKPEIAIANHAESGESIRSSIAAGRIKKIMDIIKPGDYVFVQFGHNDMKNRAQNALAEYKSDYKKLVSDICSKGAIPVLVTSMERKTGVNSNTLGNYPETVRQVAKEEDAILIDLNSMGKVLYKALGNNIDKAFQDGTHHNNFGSYELAKCIVEGIRQNIPDLAKYIVDDFSGFNPENPDSFVTFSIPASTINTSEMPVRN